MRSRLLTVAWVLLGVAIGGVATGLFARRMAVSWSLSESYTDRIDRIATSARALRDLDGNREAEARAILERELVFSLQLADELADQGAIAFLLPLGAGDSLDGLIAAESYARSHGLDATVADRAHRLRGKLCIQISPNSKYRGLCD